MKCEDALILISGHLDHTNTAEEEAALQEHLSNCAACRCVLSDFSEADEALLTAKEKAPCDLHTNVMAQIGKEANKKKYRPWAGAAVAAALLLVVGSGLIKEPQENHAPQTVSVSETDAAQRSIVKTDEQTIARQLAQERNATVVLARELYYEIEAYPCETLDTGYLLYILPDHDAAVFLGETHGCIIFDPPEEKTSDICYALLIP